MGMKKIINSRVIFENYNSCSALINDLKYTQLDHLFKINNVPFRSLLPSFLVDKGYLEKNRFTYSSKKENHKAVVVPIYIFDEFIKFRDQYQSIHVSDDSKKKALGLPLENIIERQETKALNTPQDDKFNLLKEVFKSEVSDQSKKTLLKLLDVNL
jgi:hypothetical protein